MQRQGERRSVITNGYLENGKSFTVGYQDIARLLCFVAMAVRPKAINARLGEVGATILQSAPKPLHTERVRIRLPVKAPKGSKPSSHDGANLDSNQPDFIEQLDSLSKAGPKYKIKLDPLKALEPDRKKLTTLEAQRIIGVIEELKLKSEIIIIMPHVIKELAKYKDIMGPNVYRVLKDHKQFLEEFKLVENTFFDLTGRQASVAASTSGSQFAISNLLAKESDTASGTRKVVQLSSSDKERAEPPQRYRNKATVSEQKPPDKIDTSSTSTTDNLEATVIRLNSMRLELEFTVCSILRVFRNEEDVMRKLLTEASSGRTREGSYFTQCISDLKDILFSRLLISPSEQHEKMQFLAQVAAQDRQNHIAIGKMETELELAVEEKDDEIKVLNQIIQQLQNNLQALETATEEDIRRAKTEAEKQTFSDKKASDAKKHKLNSELKLLSGSLGATTDENRGEEQLLRKKKWKVESEIENWIQKYDLEMTEKQDEYEEIDLIYQEEKKQLAELESRFNILEVEYKGIMTKRKAAKEQADVDLRLEGRRIRAATMIQSLWRAYKVRRQIHLKEKLRGKKKKKKKGKKKGKR